MDYRERIIENEISQLMAGVAALSIEGPKGVGKTATASRFAKTIIQLDEPVARELFTADARRLDRAAGPVLIDEWQREPSSWDRVRRAVDADRTPGRFLLTGSAAPMGLPMHSGAGRIVSTRMRPLSLAERGIGEPAVSLTSLLSGVRPEITGSSEIQIGDYVEAILGSGLPGLIGATGRTLRRELDGYLTRIVEREFPEMGHQVRNPLGLQRWLRAYAAATSTTASYESIRDAATGGNNDKPARSSTLPYRDVLEALWIIDPVPSWIPSGRPIARVSGTPKHQLADPAFAGRLLDLTPDSLLSGRAQTMRLAGDNTLLGALFESLVTLNVRVYAQAAEATVSHLRTRGGEHEVDLVVKGVDGRIVALDVKLAPTVNDSDVKHLHWLREQWGEGVADAAVITTGEQAYRRRDGIAVIPAALLCP